MNSEEVTPKLYHIDLKEFNALKSVDIRAWAQEYGDQCGGIRIISIAQNPQKLPTMYVSATEMGINAMRKRFYWVGEIRNICQDVALEVHEEDTNTNETN